MDKQLETKIEYLVKNIPRLIRDFSYRKGPDLYFYKRVTGIRKQNSLKKLLNDNYFFELLYATLTSWDMNARGAKMKYFDEFKNSILKNQTQFEELENFALDKVSGEKFPQVVRKVEEIYEGLHLMKTEGRLVSNSKIMHFLLPDLIMPMDRQNTLVFFFNYTMESRGKFLKIIEASWSIAKQIDLNKYLDDEWNRFVPKVIDNAIICDQSSKYRKQS